MTLDPEKKTYDMKHPIRKTIPFAGIPLVVLSVLFIVRIMKPHPNALDVSHSLYEFAIGFNPYIFARIPILFLYILIADEFVAAERK
jgi:hypothetical protein